MEWSSQQQTALDRVGKWLRCKDKQVFQLAGYAGTGKTTLAKHLVESAGGKVYFAACTGKAANVLVRSGVSNVSTVHKLIYKPQDKSQRRLNELLTERLQLLAQEPPPQTLIAKLEKAIEEEKINLSRPMFRLNEEDSPLKEASLLVLDEYSMVDRQMGEDLVSFGVPILALGDPGQLPPVRGSSYFEEEPDLLLTEIHRQAKDNPIIYLSQEVREGRQLKPGAYGTSRVLNYNDLEKEELARKVLNTDQLLVGRNATRFSSNLRVRQLMNRRTEYPEQGDKLVCLRNHHESGLLNGQIWRVFSDSALLDQSTVILDIANEEDSNRHLECLAHSQYFTGGSPPHWEVKNAQCFDYGYALTVHKSQGSQWNQVLLLDEWFQRHTRRQWLYTGITRAAERIEIVCM